MGEAEELIERLGLVPLGFEGGYHLETWRSADPLHGLPGRYEGESRSAGTAIFYLLTETCRSLMHRLRTDEIYHFYAGDPVELLLLSPDGSPQGACVLGGDILGGQAVQRVVPAGTWQGSKLAAGGRYALMGTTMSPGFSLADFELGRRTELVGQFPKWRAHIEALTPEVLETPNYELTAATADLAVAERRGIDSLLAGLGARFADGYVPREGPAGAPFWYVVRRSDRALVGAASPPEARSSWSAPEEVWIALAAWATAKSGR